MPDNSDDDVQIVTKNDCEASDTKEEVVYLILQENRPQKCFTSRSSAVQFMYDLASEVEAKWSSYDYTCTTTLEEDTIRVLGENHMQIIRYDSLLSCIKMIEIPLVQ